MPGEAHTAPLERRPSNLAAARRPVDAYVRTAESHPVASLTPTNTTNINAMDGQIVAGREGSLRLTDRVISLLFLLMTALNVL